VRARTRDALSDLFRLKVYEGEQAAMSFREGYLAGLQLWPELSAGRLSYPHTLFPLRAPLHADRDHASLQPKE